MRVGLMDLDLLNMHSLSTPMPNTSIMGIYQYFKMRKEKVDLIINTSKMHLYDKIFLVKENYSSFFDPQWMIRDDIDYYGAGWFPGLPLIPPHQMLFCKPNTQLYNTWIELYMVNNPSVAVDKLRLMQNVEYDIITYDGKLFLNKPNYDGLYHYYGVADYNFFLYPKWEKVLQVLLDVSEIHKIVMLNPITITPTSFPDIIIFLYSHRKFLRKVLKLQFNLDDLTQWNFLQYILRQFEEAKALNNEYITTNLKIRIGNTNDNIILDDTYWIQQLENYMQVLREFSSLFLYPSFVMWQDLQNSCSFAYIWSLIQNWVMQQCPATLHDFILGQLIREWDGIDAYNNNPELFLKRGAFKHNNKRLKEYYWFSQTYPQFIEQQVKKPVTKRILLS